MQTDRMTRMERLFQVNTRAVDVPGQEAEEQELYVEGYAVRFDSPTVLFEYGGTEYKEQIDRHAFDGALMEDVIFNYNHGGKVLARTRNDTLWLTVDDTGVFVRARLDGTEEGRKLYEEIAGGYIDRMSFAFTVRAECYDEEDHLWTIQKVKRLYDVSAVDIPAYDDTSIAARRAAVEDIQRAHQAALALDKRKIVLKCKL